MRLLGGFDNELNDGGERVQLQRPDTPPVDQPGLIPGLYEDEVLYDDLTPWPAADGTGVSLNRVDATAYGNASGSWIAGSPTPGRVDFSSLPGDLTGDGVVDVHDIDFLCGAISGPYMESADLNSDGTVDLADVETLVTGFLGTAMGDSNLDGQVDAVDLNRVGIHWQNMGGESWSTGDFTCDGNVTTSDLNQLGLNWQFGVAAPAQAARAPRAALSAISRPSASGVSVAPTAVDQAVREMVAKPSISVDADLTAEPEQALGQRQRRQMAVRGSLPQASPEREDLQAQLADELFADFSSF